MTRIKIGQRNIRFKADFWISRHVAQLFSRPRRVKVNLTLVPNEVHGSDVRIAVCPVCCQPAYIGRRENPVNFPGVGYLTMFTPHFLRAPSFYYRSMTEPEQLRRLRCTPTRPG